MLYGLVFQCALPLLSLCWQYTASCYRPPFDCGESCIPDSIYLQTFFIGFEKLSIGIYRSNSLMHCYRSRSLHMFMYSDWWLVIVFGPNHVIDIIIVSQPTDGCKKRIKVIVGWFAKSSCVNSAQLLSVELLKSPYNEYHGQSKRYKWHTAKVSITPVIIISV